MSSGIDHCFEMQQLLHRQENEGPSLPFQQKMLSKLIISSHNFKHFSSPQFLLKIPSFPFEKTQPNHQQFLPASFFLQIKAQHVTDDTTEVFSPRFH